MEGAGRKTRSSPKPLTGKEKLLNWLHYHWLYLIAAAVLLAVSSLLGTMLLTIWWPQVVLFEQKPLQPIKNAVFFCLFHFGKVLLSSLLQMAWWAVMFLFLPWTAFVVPVLGVWYILFVALHLIYPALDADFHVEERIEEAFPGRMGK